jgi:type IV fimbrial biogenesis protein FimT
MTKTHAQSGFTLIELLITIVVVAVLIAIAAPSFTTLIANQRSEGTAEDLVAALQLTKSEAVKRGTRVSLCAANTGGTACGSDWTEGWLMFVDSATSDAAATPVLNASTDILRYFDAPHDASNISATNNGAVNFVRYTSTGQLARIGGSNNVTPVVFDVYADKCKGDRRRNISVGVAGMMDIERTACPGA